MSHGPGLGDVGSPSFQKSKYLASLSIVEVGPEKGPGMPAGSPVKCVCHWGTVVSFSFFFFFFNALLLPIDHKILEGRVFKINSWDFSSRPVAKTPCSQCKGPGFDPQSGN